MPERADHTTAQTDPADRTVRCPVCKYDRNAIPDDQPCPECGVDVARAPERSLLRHAPPPVVRAIRRGAALTLLCVPARIATLAAAGSLVLIDQRAAGIWFIATASLVSLASALGWFWLGTPHPTIQPALPDRATRLWLRITAILTIIAGVAMPAALLAALATKDRLFESFLVPATPVVLLSLWLPLALLGVLYTREIARRAEAPHLAASARNLLKYTTIASMSLIFGVFAAILTALIPLLLVFAVPLTVPYLFFLALLVLFALIAGAGLQLKLYRAVATAARSATLGA